MKTAQCIFLPGIEFETDALFSLSAIPKAQATHLKALRPDQNEEFCFINGAGLKTFFTCVQSKGDLTFKIKSVVQVPKAMPQIHLILSPPVGDALSQAIAQSVECGVSAISFLHSEHSQWPTKKALPQDRLLRVIHSSMEQCSQSWAPELDCEWHTLEKAIKISGTNFLADEALSESGLIGLATKARFSSFAGPLKIFIGPEGGWTQSERQCFDGKAHFIGLGPHILRVPTACVSAIQILRYLAGHESEVK